MAALQNALLTEFLKGSLVAKEFLVGKLGVRRRRKEPANYYTLKENSILSASNS